MRPLKNALTHLRNLCALPLAFLREIRQRGILSALRRALAFRFHARYRFTPTYSPEAARAEIAAFPARPLVSILLPVYNVDPRWLTLAVRSVTSQLYEEWELCVVDDASPSPATRACVEALRHPRIRTLRLPENRGISGASNAALALATGDYVTLLDHDDELTPDALFESVRAIQRTGADLVYSDEDIITESGRATAAHLKPDYSPDLLLAHNYITHLLVTRRDLITRVGGFRDAFNGAQDYDLVLRLTEAATRVCHIRKVLYHWRSLPSSTSRAPAAKPYTAEAGKRALEEALARRGITAEVAHANLANFYTVRRRLPARPLVSILIPFRDRPELLRACVTAILAKTTYAEFEILGINNDSREPETLAAMNALAAQDGRVRFLEVPGAFNYSRLNNVAARAARGEVLVLMNNDITIITPDWIEALLEHALRPEVGAVGAKLYYGDERVQHAGIIVGIAGFAGHAHRFFDRHAHGYMNRLHIAHNVSAVTAALLMVTRAHYESVGGLNETELATALNDVDFCLRLRERGLLNVFTPACEAYHLESVSRGYEETEEKRARFQREIATFKTRHADLLASGDPFYNPGLTLVAENFAYRHPQPVHATHGVSDLRG